MSDGTNTAKSFAEEGLEEISQESAAAEASIGSATPTVEAAEGEMVQVGGLEPIAAYYQLRTPEKPGKTPIRIFEKDIPVMGVFERTLTRMAKAKNGQKFVAETYLVRFADDGKLYGLSAPGLKKGFNQLAEGSRVKVTYTGSAAGKDGTVYENFTIFGNKRK